MRRLTIIIILLTYATNALAVDLHHALTSAYDYNDEFKIIRCSFLNDIEKFPEALSLFLPRISASISSNSVKEKKIISPGKAPSFSDKSRHLQKTISIEQPIFNGGGSLAALKAARLNFYASLNKYYYDEQQIILKIIKDYLNCYEAEEQFNISKISLKSNQKQLEAAEEKFRLGLITGTDVAVARFSFAESETAKLAAYSHLQATQANLFKACGLNPVNITMPMLPANLPGSLEELLAKSQADPRIASLKQATQAHKAKETVAKAVLAPKVSFKLEAADHNARPARTNLPPAYHKQKRLQISSLLSVDIPIYAEGGIQYSRIRQAKNHTRLKVIELDSYIKQVKASCAAAWAEFSATRSQITTTLRGVEAAQIAYEGAVQEELIGSKTLLDVSTCEDRLHKARLSHVTANKDYILQAYKMQSFTGQLTARSLRLQVKHFNPDDEFKKIKIKIIGF